MKNCIVFFAIFFLLLASSCERSRNIYEPLSQIQNPEPNTVTNPDPNLGPDPDPNPNPYPTISLYKTWVRTGIEEFMYVYTRADSLEENEFGFIFYEDSTLIERKNATWCATPPILFANYSGRWRKASGNRLSVTVGYWGGMISYELDIVFLSSDELKVLYHFKQ